jgi:hypothetical protein
MPGYSGEPVVTSAGVACSSARQAAGASAPGIPHALCWAEINPKLGRIAPRECEAVSGRHCERSEAIHSFFARHEDCFALLAMTILAV